MKISTLKLALCYILCAVLCTGGIQANAQSIKKPPVFVLVPGAWHGGWAWQKVSAALRDKGNIVYTPTLSGLGEHKNTPHSQINLDTHIADVINLIEMEDLHDVILVGHSYAGTVIAGVADSIPERIRKLVFLDAMIVENGQSAMTIQPKEVQDALLQVVQKNGGTSVPAWSAEAFGVTNPADVQWVNQRLTAHPFGTFTQPLHLQHPYGNNLPLVYIACTNPMLPIIKTITEKIEKDKRWKYYTLNTGHDAMITQPNAVAALLEAVQ